jgi:hypothetical protein
MIHRLGDAGAAAVCPAVPLIPVQLSQLAALQGRFRHAHVDIDNRKLERRVLSKLK